MKPYAHVALALLLVSISVQEVKTEVKEIVASVIIGSTPKEFIVIEDEYDENAVAFAKYKPAYETEGWDYLALSSYMKDAVKYTDEQKSYAMGYLEGYLTYKRITPHFKNAQSYYYRENGGKMPEAAKKYLKENYAFLNKMVKQNKDKEDGYWAHMHSVMLQFEGLFNGFNDRVSQLDKIPFLDFQLLSAFGDIVELGYYKNPQAWPKFSKMTAEESANFVEDRTHCSALIKVAPDFSDVWFGHNTWFSFNMMIRIFKEYRYSSNKGTEKSKVVAFSSYPGALTSVDDFYITSKDLYVTETTNAFFNVALYDKISARAVLSWMRIMVSNRLAATSKQWMELIKMHNSGTYNNQYQVLDLKLIDTVKKKIHPEAFFILEQIPGYTETYDLTDYLKKNYWPSYNVPYSPKIYKESNISEEIAKHPENRDRYDYSNCARANIFRRDQHKVKDIESYKKMLTYNQYKTDSLSKQNPGLTIASRRDLYETERLCNGMIDVKFASINDVLNKPVKKIYLISGPTRDDQEPFDWSTTKCAEGKPHFIHEGQNTRWNFPWVEYQTKLFN